MGHVDEAEDAETSNREYDLDVRVKDNLNLPAAFETVQKRMQLAKVSASSCLTTIFQKCSYLKFLQLLKRDLLWRKYQNILP